MLTPTNKCILSPQYYGSVYYYAMLASCGQAVIDASLRYDKRFKSVHRCTIADTRGQLTLTVPVSRPKGVSVRTWSQVTVSSQAQWWADHRVSLESAYGRTPYFEFYIDRFMPWLCDTNESIVDFDCGLDRVVRRTLGLDTDVIYSLDGIDVAEYIDCRKNPFTTSAQPPCAGHSSLIQLADVPYYQVRADKLGFIPGLSILDLIFNMGPEAPLILRQMSYL